MKFEIDTDQPWDVTIKLIELALHGRGVTPMDFMLAARHHPDYSIAQADHLERQMYSSDGRPIASGN